jgi:AcrR family transcriptional regulator
LGQGDVWGVLILESQRGGWNSGAREAPQGDLERVPLSQDEERTATLSTPWGDAAALRERRLYPGAGTPAEEVARNQRERLFAAAVTVAAKKGFEAMTVADLLEMSGVSRSAFYVHFANKTECLLAAATELVNPVIAALAPQERTPELEPERAFEDFFALIAAQPAAAKVAFVELHATGEAGEELADRAFQALAETVKALNGADGAQQTSPDLATALIGGVRKLIHSRLARGEAAELEAQATQIWEWIQSVEPPPGELVVPRRLRPAGGGFQGYTPAERIARAVASLVAEKGYGAMSTDDIAARAKISLSTFYENFTDRHDALLGALEMSGAQITALAVPAARRAGDWRAGVRALYEAICHYFAAEPAMAELALVGVYGAGKDALRRRDRVIESLAAMLAPGFSENPSAPAVSAETAAATVYSLMREQVRSYGAETIAAVVPLATYVTLVGFIGPEQALAVANGEESP